MDCAEAFARKGVAIVSGAASGVDTAAHDAALNARATTVATLPQGILSFPIPKRWRHAIESGRLTLVSEFAPNLPWATHAAVTRNRTIAAMILQEALGLGLLGFLIGRVSATLWGPVFPRYVLLLVEDTARGFVITMLACVLASLIGIRMALRVDPAEAIGG